MKKYDSHNHTCHSHDAVCTAEELCRGALAAGLSGVVISDHCDMPDYSGIDSVGHILASVNEARLMAVHFAAELEVFAGIELGEAVWRPDDAAEIVSATRPDVVLSSVHAVRFGEETESFSAIDFSGWDGDTLDGYMVQYFKDMAEMVERVDMDVLTHLSNPLKYINGKYGKGISLAPYAEAIDGILRTVIERQLALELNSALIGTGYSEFMPTPAVLRRYRELGGVYVTVGSDAHTHTRVGVNFDRAARTLWDCGFKEYHYYKERKRFAVRLEG